MKQRHVPEFSDGAPWFAGTFKALRKVMTEMESNTRSDSSSRPGTSDSGGSASSKHESNSGVLGQSLLGDFTVAMGTSLQCIPWDPENLMFDARLFSRSYFELIRQWSDVKEIQTWTRNCSGNQ